LGRAAPSSAARFCARLFVVVQLPERWRTSRRANFRSHRVLVACLHTAFLIFVNFRFDPDVDTIRIATGLHRLGEFTCFDQAIAVLAGKSDPALTQIESERNFIIVLTFAGVCRGE
jgi:hypothetical protein